jgi:hypothetical protein
MKNCKYLFLVSSILAIGCTRESKSQEIGSGKDSAGYRLVYDHAADTAYDYSMFKQSIIKDYVDSLNSFKRGTELPNFLRDINLDVNSKINDWYNSNYVSLREEIFKQVDNVDLLKEIVNTSYFQHQFDNIEKRRPKVPSDDVSTYVLAKDRLEALLK